MPGTGNVVTGKVVTGQPVAGPSTVQPDAGTVNTVKQEVQVNTLELVLLRNIQQIQC